MTYQHGANLDFEGRFTLDMDDDFFTGDLAHVGLQYAPRVDGDATVNFRLPMRIGLAAGYAPSRDFRLEVRGQYVTWSDMDAMYASSCVRPGSRSPRSACRPRARWRSAQLATTPCPWPSRGGFAVHARVRAPGPCSGTTARRARIRPSTPRHPDGHRLTFGAGAGIRAHAGHEPRRRRAAHHARAADRDRLGRTTWATATYSLSLAAVDGAPAGEVLMTSRAPHVPVVRVHRSALALAALRLGRPGRHGRLTGEAPEDGSPPRADAGAPPTLPPANAGRRAGRTRWALDPDPPPR
jgi:hypothetical protein